MKNNLLAILAMTIGLLLVSGPMFAHHSDSVYDQERLITVTGTVTKFEFINPHELIHFDVKDDKGNLVQWVALGSPPNALTRVGWNSHIIKPGERLTISGFQYYDGRPIMLHLKIVRSNGELVPTGVAEQNFWDRFEARQGKKQ